MQGIELEQELRDYFQIETENIEPPHEWWENIISNLAERKRRVSWGFIPRTRLAWVLLPLLLLLIAGTVYGASTLVKELFQKFATDVEKAGLAQELNLSQTIDDVTVRLERAYIDANVVLVGFTVSGPNARYHVDFGKLSTIDGQDIPGMIGMGTVPGSEMILGEWGKSERVAAIAAFDASIIQGLSSEIGLRLETQVEEWSILGEIQSTTGPFIFEFSVPFHSGKVINIEQTVEASGVSITLEDVVISPWATRATFQFQSQDNTLSPIVSLELPNGEIKNVTFGKYLETSSAQYFMGDFTDAHGNWTIVISELVFHPDVTKATEVPGSGGKAFTGKAEDIKRLAGPWIFHFQVP
ncbi:MAG: DUF4179 domain-containing protein [Dehalococcoidales bacterium]|nr:DUF4179 domain-containing protein [Dehalococcoidales bacterium]